MLTELRRLHYPAMIASATAVVGYNVTNGGSNNSVRPLAVLEGGATARAILNEQGEVVHVTTGLAPLGITGPNASRRGQDLMMSDALAFDVQVFDPEAPVYAFEPMAGRLEDNGQRMS